MTSLGASIALAIRLDASWPLVAVSALLGLAVYVAVSIAGRRVHVELAVLLSVFLIGFILGGGHFLHAALLARAIDAGTARWATALSIIGTIALAALIIGALERRRS